MRRQFPALRMQEDKGDERHNPGGGAGRLAGRGAWRRRLGAPARAGRGGVFLRCFRRSGRRGGEIGGFRHSAVDAGADTSARLADQPAAETADAGHHRRAQPVVGHAGLYRSRDSGVLHPRRCQCRLCDRGIGAGAADLGGARAGGGGCEDPRRRVPDEAFRSGSGWLGRP